MKRLTEAEINFIKKTGWTPTVEQCDEWDRTIFAKIFNKEDFKKKYIDECGFVVDEFSNKVNEYVLKNYNIDTNDLYKKLTEEYDGISLEYDATYLLYTFFTSEELLDMDTSWALKWLQDFKYYVGYRKWDEQFVEIEIQEALAVYGGSREFYECPDDGSIWNREIED